MNFTANNLHIKTKKEVSLPEVVKSAINLVEVSIGVWSNRGAIVHRNKWDF